MTKSLGSWQLVSLISRFTALFLGLVQSVIIARILNVSEFGVIGLVGAIGALAGIAQHLGLASGTTREISSTTSKDDIFKIFLSSISIKYLISIPIAVILFFLAPYIAQNIYQHPEIVLPIRLYAAVLLVQGVQSVLNSVIAGLQRFKRLFLYQAAIAVVSLLVYVPLVFFFRVDGYFYALLVFNLMASLSLGYLALWPIRDHLKKPSGSEFKGYFKSIFLLSVGIYAVKIIYTLWFKFGQLTLGYLNVLEDVGVFSFALLYASKLQTISDALTDVNLPFFSKEFQNNFENFKKMFRQNFDKLFLLILLAAIAAAYWSNEIILLAVGEKYASSIPLVLPLVGSFVFYSYMNILKSSVMIPAKLMAEMVMGFILMLLATGTVFLVSYSALGSLSSMSLSMLAGTLVGFISMAIMIYRKLGLAVIGRKSLLIFVLLSGLLVGIMPAWSLVSKVLYFVMYLVLLAFVMERTKLFKVSGLIRLPVK